MEKVKEIANKENELSSLDKLVEGKINLSEKTKSQDSDSYGATLQKQSGTLKNSNKRSPRQISRFQGKLKLFTIKKQKREKEELEQQLNSLKGKELEERSLLNGIKDRIHFIQTLIDNLRGRRQKAQKLCSKIITGTSEINPCLPILATLRRITV
ncbi:MAG: hypothetical protein MZV64_62275 [Ignavibacteriales bacterium]|nr:hypothetical protein [Ignavibacteriales bacterium]